jgi:hypothetical protein
MMMNREFVLLLEMKFSSLMMVVEELIVFEVDRYEHLIDQFFQELFEFVHRVMVKYDNYLKSDLIFFEYHLID